MGDAFYKDACSLSHWKMKIVRISFENFEKNKESQFSLCGDFAKDKKLLKKKINEIIEEVFKNGRRI